MTGKAEEQLAEVEALSRLDLRSKWSELTNRPRPRISPSLLRLALAWEIQARASGGHSRSIQQQLAQLSAGKTRTSRTTPGMRLVREWRGRVHVVTVGGDQVVRWEDREYRSLSEVARAITGTRWSGPAFFGLKRKVRP